MKGPVLARALMIHTTEDGTLTAVTDMPRPSPQAFGRVVRGFAGGMTDVVGDPLLPLSPRFGTRLPPGRASAGRLGIGTHDAIQGAALVAVAVEATDEVPTVLVAQGDGDLQPH